MFEQCLSQRCRPEPNPHPESCRKHEPGLICFLQSTTYPYWSKHISQFKHVPLWQLLSFAAVSFLIQKQTWCFRAHLSDFCTSAGKCHSRSNSAPWLWKCMIYIHKSWKTSCGEQLLLVTEIQAQNQSPHTRTRRLVPHELTDSFWASLPAPPKRLPTIHISLRH